MPKEPKTAAEEKESVTADLVAKLAVAADAMRQYATLADSLAHIVAKNPDDAELTDAIQEALVTAKPTRKRKLPVAAAANANSEDATSKKRKREKKPKDPNAPKRPASAYLIFQNGIRAKLKADNPNLQQKDLLQMISLQWAQMSDEDKQPYYSQVAEAKEKFQMDKAAYDIRDVDGDSPVAELPAPSKPSKKPVKQASEEPAIKKTAKKVAAVSHTSPFALS
ncbi:high mobility group box domain-containing protein [Hygrophoropsis aurantiaca]|uniref:High mobility group box domain-containing protein n=1 Tax=Hygrophoropsis aurantiaca TaxID=72124 RepID=A0ACB8AH06_9AGAM|nr:high mobility group box domain-containing protein [Hygrophoropsis aurantiaca]